MRRCSEEDSINPIVSISLNVLTIFPLVWGMLRRFTVDAFRFFNTSSVTLAIIYNLSFAFHHIPCFGRLIVYQSFTFFAQDFFVTCLQLLGLNVLLSVLPYRLPIPPTYY